VEQRYKWATVFAGFLASVGSAAVVSSYAYGQFIKAIAGEFDWSRADTTLSITAFYIGAGCGFIPLGAWIARSGIKLPTLTFVGGFGLSLMAVALVPASVPIFTGLFFLVGFFAAGSTLMPYAVALSGWFDEKRGLTIAIANTGTSVGGVFMAPYALWLLDNFGWRYGYVGLGLYATIIPAIALVFFLHSPPRPPQTSQRHASHLSWGAIVKNVAFWQIGIPMFAMAVALLGTITSLAPMLTDRRIDTHDAASMLAVVGGASFFSRVGVGLILDRLHVKVVIGTIILIVLTGLLIFLFVHSGPMLWIAAVCVGFGIGAEGEALGYSASRYFSQDALAKSLAALWIFFTWGGGVGAILGSISFDYTQSYEASLWLFLILAVLSLFIISTLGPYRFAQAESVRPVRHSGVPSGLRADPEGSAN
jgi:predicted MFS family arabinose efflux permease